MNTIASYLENRDNNFSLIRFIAATLVILSHSYPIALGKGTPEPPSTWIGMDFGNIAVIIFFVVSGFLVSKSFCDRNHLLTFLYARCLRIFPALVIAVCFCVFVVGPLFTQLSLESYFTDTMIYKYVVKNISLVFFDLQYDLPGVFSKNRYPLAVNGSLWTLPIELHMYFLVALMGVADLLRTRYIFNIFALLVTLLYIYVYYFLSIHSPMWWLSGFFFVGVVFYINNKIIPLNGYILLAIVILTVISWKTAAFSLLFSLFLVYATFWCAFVPAGTIRKFNEMGDYSYGLYIYAFPIQQILATLYIGIQPLPMFVSAFVITLLLAYFSWHLVEKRALALKTRRYSKSQIN